MNNFLSFIVDIPHLQDNTIAIIKNKTPLSGDDVVMVSGNETRQTGSCALLSPILSNHIYNTLLWCREDEARREDTGFMAVYHAKRTIDKLNQLRNNMMEAIDNVFVDYCAPSEEPVCPSHSETPGMMIDRLSILSLKIYHMHIEAERITADAAHRARCAEKEVVLTRQRAQLHACLQAVSIGFFEKTITFHTYRQFKMYNDPDLNPALYTHK